MNHDLPAGLYALGIILVAVATGLAATPQAAIGVLAFGCASGALIALLLTKDDQWPR